MVMLLPHSYDGQGPEHSSGRMERYLQLCAEENMIVANVTTPAQYFHILRRQMFMTHKMPLILFTPKSMLRHPQAVSPFKDLYHGEFHHVIDDNTDNAGNISRVVLVSGKLYYELVAQREKLGNTNTAIVRLEQIYPLHEEMLNEIISGYTNANEIVWAQEEPKNMGAFGFLMPRMLKLLGREKSFYYVGRVEGASTATGYAKRHTKEQESILNEAFGELSDKVF